MISLGVNLYTKKMVGAKLAWKQTCQIYLQHDKIMERTLDCKLYTVKNQPISFC